MHYRTERINSEMRKVLAQIISRLKDPRMTEPVTVTNVDVAKDLKTAKVLVEIAGEKERVSETFETLCRSSGFIRKELAKEFHDLRTTPELTFAIDNSLEYSAHIDRLLEEIRRSDDSAKH